MKTLEELVKELPPELQQEVEDFARFLLEKRVKKPKGKLKFDWEGALQDMRDEYTSVELQHKINEWRGDKNVSSGHKPGAGSAIVTSQSRRSEEGI